MQVKILYSVPDEYKSVKGKTYETKYIYIGMSRYDPEKKTLTKFVEGANGISMHETPCEHATFARGYHTELVRVTVYSESPRIWKEEIAPHVAHFFQQVTQVA